MDHYAGIDVPLECASVCVVDASGKIVREGKVASVSGDWLDQSGAQVEASGGRPIRWYFAEPATAAFAERLFETGGGGRDRIEIKVLPWPGSRP